jgi:hypothetical protein
MEKISRSVRQAKQAKILDADCTCPYSPYGPTWQGRTIHTMMCQVDDVARIHWLMVVESNRMTRVIWLANGVRTRGPIGGRHVSLIILVMWLYIKYMGVCGVRPPDLPNT